MFSDPKYNFSVCQKIFYLIQSKVNIFHQIQPKHITIFYPVRSLQVMNDHSGYHFPLSFSPEFHDFHHLKFHTSYGWLGVQDWIHGTDAQFK